MKKNASKNHFMKVLGFVCILTILAAASALPVFSSPVPIPVPAAPDPLIPFTTYTIPTRGGSHTWEVPVSNTLVKPKMDVMFVLDTTGSMHSILPTISSAITDFTADMMAAGATDIHWGAAFFGDMDVDRPWFGIELLLGDYPLATVMSAIENLPLTGGGDPPEDPLAAYMWTIELTDWRQDAQHVIVIVTDNPTKTAANPPRGTITYGGHPITFTGAAAYSSEKNIIPCLMTFSTIPQLKDWADALRYPENLWRTKEDLLARLHTAIIAPVTGDGEDYYYKAEVISTTYEDTGLPSLDVDITIDPSNFLLKNGERKEFEFLAEGKYNPDRFNATTIVEIGFFVRANEDDEWKWIESATQYIRYRVGDHSVIYNVNTTDPTVSDPPVTTTHTEGDEVMVEGGLRRAAPYIFIGWNTEPDGSGTYYDPEDVFTMPNEDVTLYAIWYPRPVGRIIKDADVTEVGLGDTYSYSLKIINSALSSEDWKNVIVTDILPANLEWVSTEIINRSGSRDPDDVKAYFDLVTNTVSIECGNIIGDDDETEDKVVEVKITVKLISGVGGEYIENTAVAESYNDVPKSDMERTLILYTVTYEANGGIGGPHLESGISYDSDHVVLDIGTPTGISCPGFTFLGWNTKADGTGGNYYPGSFLHVIIDTILYARWYESRTVTYHANNGTGDIYELADVALGSNHSVLGVGVPVNFSYPDHIFLGWKDEDGVEYDPEDEFIVDSDKDLYARWVKISYEANGGTGGPYIETEIPPSKEHTVLAVEYTGIDRIGYTFVRWNTEPDGTGDPYNPGVKIPITDEDVTFYAQWLVNKYIVTYNANGGIGGPYKTAEMPYGSIHEALDLPDTSISREGFTFLGWGLEDADDNVDYDVGEEITVDGDITLYAKWGCTVTYDANGGAGGTYDDEIVAPGSEYTVLSIGSPVNFSRSSHTFSGWNTAANGSGTSYAVGAEITVEKDITLYAQWSSSGGGGTTPTTYTVTYDANEGTGGPYNVRNISSGSNHTVLARSATGINRSGHTFQGWNTKEDGTGTDYKEGSSLPVTSNITLYAQWSKDQELDTENHFAYIIGYTDGNVRPGGNITRAEVATIFFRLLTQSSRASMWSKNNNFPDVSAAAWYNNAISTLTRGNILTGYPDGNFRPKNTITRAELAAIAVRFASADDIAQVTNRPSFSDISGHWAQDHITLAGALGYVNGYPDGSFRPNTPITRAEVANLTNNVLNRHVESADDLLSGMKTWPDNTSGTWYYLPIQEATNSHFYTRKADGKNEIWATIRTNPDWAALEKPTSQPGDVDY